MIEVIFFFFAEIKWLIAAVPYLPEQMHKFENRTKRYSLSWARGIKASHKWILWAQSCQKRAQVASMLESWDRSPHPVQSYRSSIVLWKDFSIGCSYIMELYLCFHWFEQASLSINEMTLSSSASQSSAHLVPNYCLGSSEDNNTSLSCLHWDLWLLDTADSLVCSTLSLTYHHGLNQSILPTGIEACEVWWSKIYTLEEKVNLTRSLQALPNVRQITSISLQEHLFASLTMYKKSPRSVLHTRKLRSYLVFSFMVSLDLCARSSCDAQPLWIPTFYCSDIEAKTRADQAQSVNYICV